MLAAVFLLAGIGVAALWSASSEYALSLGRPSGYFALRQAVFMLPSALIFWVCASIDLDALRAKTDAFTLIALGFLLLPFIPGLGENRNGATRWIDLRFMTLQPSELWKPALVLYLAHILDKKHERMNETAGVLVPPFILVSLGCLLVFAQNDFSTAMISAVTAIAVFWVAGSPFSFFLSLSAAVTPLAALSILTSDFRLRRILAFLFPAYEPHGQSYQILGSIRAIRSGGQGLRPRLPEARLHTRSAIGFHLRRVDGRNRPNRRSRRPGAVRLSRMARDPSGHLGNRWIQILPRNRNGLPIEP
jgi:cell division protein FtsW